MAAQIKLFVSSKREKVEQEVNDFLNENKRKTKFDFSHLTAQQTLNFDL